MHQIEFDVLNILEIFDVKFARACGQRISRRDAVSNNNFACTTGVPGSCVVNREMRCEIGNTHMAQAYVVCMVCYVTSKLHQMLDSCCLGGDILVALSAG